MSHSQSWIMSSIGPHSMWALVQWFFGIYVVNLEGFCDGQHS